VPVSLLFLPRLLLPVLVVGLGAVPAVAAAEPSDAVPAPTAKRSYTATPAFERTKVYAAPGRRGTPITVLHTGSDATNDPLDLLGDGLLVLGSKADAAGHLWYRVQLLQKPRGRSGYIDADRAQLSANPYRVVVRLRRRTVTIYRAGRAILATRAVVGKPATPTPTGLFAIAKQIDCVQFTCSSPFVGSAINLLTAYSPVYQATGFAGGPGIVAIHGRGPSSLGDPLGSARSHGCIRVPNAVATWILDTLIPGTPVQVTR
jgi:hypothetical protein